MSDTENTVKIRDNKGAVRAYEFVTREALEMFLEDLPSGWALSS